MFNLTKLVQDIRKQAQNTGAVFKGVTKEIPNAVKDVAKPIVGIGKNIPAAVKSVAKPFEGAAKDIVSPFTQEAKALPQEVKKYSAPLVNVAKPFAKGLGLTVNEVKQSIAQKSPAPLVRGLTETLSKNVPDYSRAVIRDVHGNPLLDSDGKRQIDKKILEEERHKNANLILGFTGGETGEKNVVKETVSKLSKTAKEDDVFKILVSSLKLTSKDAAKIVPEIAKTTDTAAISKILKKVSEDSTSVPQASNKFEPLKYVDDLTRASKDAAKVEKPTLSSKAGSILSTLKRKLVDSNAPIEDLLSRSQKEFKYKIRPEYDITHQIDRTYRAPTIAGQFAKDNGLVQVIKDVPNIDALDQYLIAKHASTVEKGGIKTGRDTIKDQKLIEALAPEYEPYAKKVTEYSQKLLDYSVESGLISKDLATKLKEIYPDYVPLNRVFSELEKTNKPLGSKAVASLSKQSIVQKLHGSDRAIESPIESLLAKTNDAFVQGEKNKSARLLAGYKDLPGFEGVIKELKPGENASHTFSYLDNGTKKLFSTTPEIAAAAKALDVEQLNVLGKILAAPVRIARLGITGLNIPFVGANIVKDQMLAFVTSSEGLKTSAANPKVFLDALFNAVGHGELYDDLVRAGGGGTSFDISRNQVTETVEKIRSGRSLGSKTKYTVSHPIKSTGDFLRAIEDVIGRSEELTRLQQFKGTKDALLKQGRTHTDATIEAAKAARENTANFHRKGEWGKVLNSAFLYLNAGIQGPRALIRGFSRAPVATSTKIATAVLLPTAILTSWNLSDNARKKAYSDIPEYEKKNNLIIIPPNPSQDGKGRWNVVKIPLSPDLAGLASSVRLGLEAAESHAKPKFLDIATALIGSVSPVEPSKNSIVSRVIPQAILPEVQAASNYNFYQGRQQVSKSLQGKATQDQVYPTTSGTARLIGNKLNQSPIKVEEFIKGSIGGVGSQILNASDNALATSRIIPKSQIGGQSVLGGIEARFTKSPGGQTDRNALDEVFQYKENSTAQSSINDKKAEELWKELKLLPKDQAAKRFSSLASSDKALAQNIADIAEAEKLSLSSTDKAIKQLGVEDGTRAKYIFDNLNKLKTKEEKNAYYQRLIEKKLISQKVSDQINILLKGD